MFKERIQEVFEFTKSESPYKKANKGWINQDIFLDLSPSVAKNSPANEAAKVIFFWSPINSLLSNIFWILIVCSILVFSSVSISEGRFDFDFLNNSSILDTVINEKDQSLDLSQSKDIDSTKSITKENVDKKDIDKTKKIDLLDNNLMKSDQNLIQKNESLIKNFESNKDTKILQNKKSKSNFI